MKIADVFRDRAALTAALDPSHPKYVTGSEEDRKQARAEWHRQRFIADVMRSNLPEIPRSDLKQLPFGQLEDTRNGTFYRPRRDGLIDLACTPAVGYYVDVAGIPVLLEPPAGAKNRAELEAQQAGREQRRAAQASRTPRGMRP
jgi:hypothetical protein